MVWGKSATKENLMKTGPPIRRVDENILLKCEITNIQEKNHQYMP
jgi:hypothetical protein